MRNIEVFRPWSSYLLAGTVFFLTAGLCFELVITASFHDALAGIAWGIFASWGAYLLFIRPKVTVFDEGITITNPFVEITVGWHRVEEIDARYCMSIEVGEKLIYAWAAPAPSRYHARNIHSSDVRGLKLNDNTLIRPGESPGTHSGAATYLARTRLDNFRKTHNTARIESVLQYNVIGGAILGGSFSIGALLVLIHF